MKKRLISSILIMVMAISLLSVSASAASTKNLLVNPSFEDGLTGWNDPGDLMTLYTFKMPACGAYNRYNK